MTEIRGTIGYKVAEEIVALSAPANGSMAHAKGGEACNEGGPKPPRQTVSGTLDGT